MVQILLNHGRELLYNQLQADKYFFETKLSK